MGFQPEKTCENCVSFYTCKPRKDARFCRDYRQISPPPPLNTMSSVQRKKDETKIFLEIGMETVPSEMTARILLKLIENYCNHFDKSVAARYNGEIKTLDFI